MLAKLIEGIRTRLAVRQLDQLPAAGIGRHAINEYWRNNKDASGRFSPEFVQNEAAKMMEEVIKVATSPNPRMANREQLAAQVFEYAKLQALVLNPEPSPDPTGLRGQPGITGELRAHALELVKKDKDLQEFMHGIDEPKGLDDVLSAFDARYRVLHAWTHVFQLLRAAFDDVNHATEKDWFKPFVAVMCAWHEHHFRRTLGLPHSLPGSSSEADVASLSLSGFMECVTSAARYPDLEWRQRVQRIEGARDLPGLRF